MSITKKEYIITKASGEKVIFKESKLKQSLEYAGASDDLIQNILFQIKKSLYPEITTKEIYTLAFKILKQYAKISAAKYKLKQAIFELGPTGYPFEKYVAEILSYQSFQTNVGVIVQGHCVSHEVDVVAIKENKHYMIECKFHNKQGTKTDVKVPMYIFSRFKDVERQWKKHPQHQSMFHQGWIVTNTRFTSDAIKFGSCIGLHLIGWDYPKKGSLKKRIELSGLYPITSVIGLSKNEKQKILEKGIVLCKDILKNPIILTEVLNSPKKEKQILSEISLLCNSTNL